MHRILLTVPLLVLACQPDSSRSEAPAAESRASLSASASTPLTPAAPARAKEGAEVRKGAELILVEKPSEVCMVNDQFMGQQQIPVEVEGKTYFGCCPMCKDRLANDPSFRVATDPVSGKSVDKATAVIAKRANGEVVYFETLANFDRYRRM